MNRKTLIEHIEETAEFYKTTSINDAEYLKKLIVRNLRDIKRRYEKYDMNSIKNLENALDEIENILDKPQYEYDNIPTNYEEDILKIREIIKKAKGE